MSLWFYISFQKLVVEEDMAFCHHSTMVLIFLLLCIHVYIDTTVPTYPNCN